MEKQEITIPNGCRAIIENGVIIIEKIEPEKPKFKRGDIIYWHWDDGHFEAKNVQIFNKYIESKASDIARLNVYGRNVSNIGELHDAGSEFVFRNIVELRLATESEKQILFDALAKIGKEWDAEKMKVVDIDWPKDKDIFYYPYFDEEMFEMDVFDSNVEWDIFRKKHNLCFRTKEEAIAKTKEFLNIK